MTFFVLVLLLTLLFVLRKIYQRKKESGYNLPPGPRGLPIIGNNLQIATNAPLQLSKWAKQYGKLYTIRIGNNLPTLVVSDVALMKQLFGSMASTGKFHNEIIGTLFEGSCGVLGAEGRVWQEQREFMVKTLKKATGIGKEKSVGSMILSEVELFGEWMEKEMRAKGEVVLSESLKKSSGNALWTIVTGENMSDAESHLVENWLRSMQKVAQSGLAFFSWIKYIAPEWSGYRAYVKACQEIHRFVKRCFEEHKSQMAKGNYDGGDVVSAYIEHMEKMKNNSGSSFSGADGYRHSVQSVNALLMAGTETSATTLHWLIFYLCVYPDVQRKVQQEIDEIVGTDRDPMLTDRKTMPYMDAVIQETLRKSSVGPFGIIHRLLEDVPFGDSKLPKNLLLLPNLYHIHHDSAIWGDPENFRPERFLEKNTGNSSAGCEGLKEFVVAFQGGSKRACLGEGLARDIIFLFVTKLLQQFNLFLPPGVNKEMYMKQEFGIIVAPKDLGIKISRRK